MFLIQWDLKYNQMSFSFFKITVQNVKDLILAKLLDHLILLSYYNNKRDINLCPFFLRFFNIILWI